MVLIGFQIIHSSIIFTGMHQLFNRVALVGKQINLVLLSKMEYDSGFMHNFV